MKIQISTLVASSVISAALVLPLFSVAASAHSGRLDDLGCHNFNADGTYHCHSGPLAGRTFASRAEAEAALEE